MSRRDTDSSFTKPTDPYDDELRSLRESEALPFSKSPFVDPNEPGDEGEESEPLLPGESRVIVPDELPWSDLLLEVAMSTAFASLADGTPILLPQNVVSYFAFFILVWWIWTSQVAYNMRFRQADWLHRIYVFLQLIVFSALAAFTRNFDITACLLPVNEGEISLQRQLLLQLGLSNDDLDALQFRDDRLPRLNARGVSMTMALSRLLLLVQYCIVYYHARRLKKLAIVTHITAIAFSAICYLTAFFLIGEGDGPVPKEVQMVKIGLWYIPILVEIASHFVANMLPGHVRYTTEGVSARSSTLFIIILGGGLDKITGGFQDIVGNAGLGIRGMGIFLSAAVIFLTEFSLYFKSSGSVKKVGSQRALLWFFTHVVYLAALIIALQAIATSLRFSNLNYAINEQMKTIQPIISSVQANPNQNVTASDFPVARRSFDGLGLSLNGVIQNLQAGVQEGFQLSSPAVVNGSALQQRMNVTNMILQIFDAQPEENTLLWAQQQVFLNSNVTNTTAVNLAAFSEIYGGIIKWRGSSALWFYPAAGSTILGLVLLSLIKGRPRDKWEWGSIISRLIVGIFVVSLSLLSIGAYKPPINPDGTPTSSIIWKLNWNGLLLPIFAICIGLLLCVEIVLINLACRTYYSFESLGLFKPRPRMRPLRTSVGSVLAGKRTNSPESMHVSMDDKSESLDEERVELLDSMPYERGAERRRGRGSREFDDDEKEG